MESHVHRHGTEVRGAQLAPDSPFFEGRFGRMFQHLPRFRPSEKSLRDLAGHMFEPKTGNLAKFENPDIPAGYTYLGQFIDHDITFDPASSLQRRDATFLEISRTGR